MPVELALTNETVQTWISSYRQLLDSWGLWGPRADFDIALHKAGINKKHPQQVIITFNLLFISNKKKVLQILYKKYEKS